MKSHIAAAFTTALDSATIPSEICYIPEGEHDISATVNGKPGTVRVRVPRERGQEITGRLQAALAARQAENVRPHFGFDHKEGPASALPQSFRYEPGVGVMCSLDWTASGRAAIEGKDWSYFSPCFLLGDDGTPNSLPAKGEMGSLVNSPAFRSIQRIAASDPGAGDDRFYRDLAATTAGELRSEEEAKAYIEEYGVEGNKTTAERMEEREKAEAAASQPFK